MTVFNGLKNFEFGGRKMLQFLKKTIIGATVVMGLGSTGVQAQQVPAYRFHEGDLISPDDALTYYGTGTQHTASHTKSYHPETEITVMVDRLGRELFQNGKITEEEYISRVFEFVQNNIQITFTFGLTKGARGALIDQAGTAFDQTALFVELVRVAGISASYEMGTLTLSADDFGRWSGLVVPTAVAENNKVTAFTVNAKSACRLLANGGIPAKINGSAGDGTCNYNGNLSKVQFLHIWAEVNGNLYDPAFKKYTLYSSQALSNATSCGTKSNCADQAVNAGMLYSNSGEVGSGNFGDPENAKYIQNYNETNLKKALDGYAESVQNYIKNSMPSASLEEFVGGKILEVQEAEDAFIPINRDNSPKVWTGDIPDQYRTSLTVQFDQINKKLWADEIAGRRLRIFGKNNQSITTLQGMHTRKVSLYLEYEIVASSVYSAATPYNDSLILKVDPPYVAEGGRYLNTEITRVTDSSILAVLKYNNGAPVIDVDTTKVYFNPITIVASFGDVGSGALTYYTALQDKNKRYFSVPSTNEAEEDFIFNDPTRCQFSDFYDYFIINGTSTLIRTECLRLIDPTFAANFLTQDSRFQRIVGAVHNGLITTHHVLGFIGRGNISLEAERSTVSNENVMADEAGMSLSGTMFSNWLEGGVIEQSAGQWNNGSGSWYLGVSNALGQKFFLLTDDNKSTVFSNAPNYDGTHQSFLQQYLTPGLSIILPESSYLGQVDTDLFSDSLVRMGFDYELWSGETVIPDYRDGESSQGAAYINYRNALFSFSNDLKNLGLVMNNGMKGGVPEITDPIDEVLKSTKAIARSAEPNKVYKVNASSGSLSLSEISDLVVGSGSFPRSLSFTRSYSSLKSAVPNNQGKILGQGGQIQIRDFPVFLSETPGSVIGAGWDHNFQISLTLESSPLQAMGADSAIDASAILAGIYVLSGTAQNIGQFDHSLSSIFITNWLGKNTVLNAANIKAPNLTGIYFKLPDGSFNPPTGIVAALTQKKKLWGPSSLSHTLLNVFTFMEFELEDKSGNKLSFKTAQEEFTAGVDFSDQSQRIGSGQVYRRPSLQRFQPYSWTFLTGEQINFEYIDESLRAHCLQKISNNYGHKLNFTYHVLASATGVPSSSLPCPIATVSDGTGRAASYDDITHRTTGHAWPPFTMRVTLPDGTVEYYDFNSSMDGNSTPHQLHSQLANWRNSGNSSLNLFSAEYDQRGFLKSITDANNNTTQYSFQFFDSSLSPKTTVMDALGQETSLLFDKNRNPVEVEDALGKISRSTYDGLGRNVSQINPEGNSVEKSYDALGNVIEKKLIPKPLSGEPVLISTFTYEDSIWPTKVTSISDPDGNKTYAYYDPSTGFLLRKIQELTPGSCSTQTTVSSSNCAVTKYNYKSSVPHLLETVTDPENIVTQLSYDGYGNLRSKIVDYGSLPHKNLKTVYFYDAVGNLCRTIDPRGSSGLMGGHDAACDN